jgi:hypothetical protein
MWIQALAVSAGGGRGFNASQHRMLGNRTFLFQNFTKAKVW